MVMLGSAALRQRAAAHLNDTSSARNAYPAFSAPFASIGERAARRLALFVHRKAPCAAGKAMKRRPTAGKTMRKRKQDERVSRCGIRAR
ncbi:MULTISPECIES: hypothetical protein [Bradyrhizobium]|uniref:Uncharacterized protein n=1 Tax=Bradyrhizobium brasilense TaxID=1419277 RepID=A0ABY8JHU2_9BRAD|nr:MULTISPECIES: hypothetical protein [Bradyrhizobium]MCP1912030.1 hypothetical protein [Bradyrhizobium elkanii]MCP1829640.1 hypothetical protein [Bradyrhizobium sp. USDA 4545]MCP1848244.1 hypothetical protein [Bradyrhizobium sp. USDA 4541]MCP1922749.1 hypothetical protein [Bradyrhizobium sp. USDA 4532]WFU64739.1 hypothetical protein QA636_04065 [Bradyrhizobium brasilense]